MNALFIVGLALLVIGITGLCWAYNNPKINHSEAYGNLWIFLLFAMMIIIGLVCLCIRGIQLLGSL